jgi:aspartyl-tRNA(Asn)/glutamyl-tRNA(Gln) amidotransferase subunit B
LCRGREAKAAANLICNDLFGLLKARATSATTGLLEGSRVTADSLGALMDLVSQGVISSRSGKEVLAEMVEGGGQPGEIVKAKGLQQITDVEEIRAVVR